MKLLDLLLIVALCGAGVLPAARGDAIVAPATAGPGVLAAGSQRLPAVLGDRPISSAIPLADESQVVPAAFREEFAYEEYRAPQSNEVDPNATRLLESMWYVRVDYFYWAEQVDGYPFMENNGAMPTLGWEHRRGRQRVRAELFGSQVDYYADMGGLANHNVTDYLGLRGEYELLFEPPNWKNINFFGGLGTRFFVRSIPDVLLTPSLVIDGYQESWWTFYPYFGAESRRTMHAGWEAFWRGRIGVTAFTREHVALDDITLFPRANLTGQLELGFRGPRLSIGAFCEVMAWSESKPVLAYDGRYLFEARQPDSQNVLVGLKTGWSY